MAIPAIAMPLPSGFFIPMIPIIRAAIPASSPKNAAHDDTRANIPVIMEAIARPLVCDDAAIGCW